MSDVSFCMSQLGYVTSLFISFYQLFLFRVCSLSVLFIHPLLLHYIIFIPSCLINSKHLFRQTPSAPTESYSDQQVHEHAFTGTFSIMHYRVLDNRKNYMYHSHPRTEFVQLNRKRWNGGNVKRT